MKTQFQSKTSQELNLSFDLEILNHENRTLDIKINSLLRNIQYGESFFDWFVEDLLFLLDSNRYQKRWDYGQINILGIKNLNLQPQQQAEFIKAFKSVTNFDLVNKE
ncbi:hypothetical protein BCF59_0562 [Mycoplasmopsis mustelae]|uniref:Uncharacterized protein n=1 Tax=Mycoplasmopsis mustelae TaxID=171289 RepID=A0A4R7UC93_9BACT|nr:hypothetical protein [Mycoplasmopsis mustelae]TDV23571.1 hypothetical protein BCF59_0562 [Mycoplasmopsis mustelae]